MQLISEEHERGRTPRLRDVPDPAETLHAGLGALSQFPEPHWISCGTLLGLHRDGGFIPNDTDIDVGMRVSKGNDLLERVLIAMPPRFRRRRTLRVAGVGPMQMAFRDSEQADITFDIYFYYDDIEDGLLMNFNTATPILRKPLALFEGIVGWKSPVGRVPAPRDRDAYCEMRYGAGWRTPSESKGIYRGKK